MNDIIIPFALQIVCDDVGWFCGKNSLADGGPARTGISRDHEKEDLLVFDELGRRLNMKIVCGLPLGEWDKNNRLRNMPHATDNEKGWDRASQLDYKKARDFFSVLNGSEYIDIAFHGLMHGYWVDGENYGNPREFYSYDLPKGATERRVDYPCVPVSADYVDSHLAAWFDIYKSWGFSKSVTTFISPAGLHRDDQKALFYAEKLKNYGFLYWKNGQDGFTGDTRVFGDLIFLSGDSELLDWDVIDADIGALPDAPATRSVFAAHWPNFLRTDYKESSEYISLWEKYFLRQAERFGFMLSRDMAFSCTQAQYRAHTALSFDGNTLTADVSAVKKTGAKGLLDSFYMSFKDSLVPKSFSGAAISPYETHDGFTTYKITPTEEKITISF